MLRSTSAPTTGQTVDTAERPVPDKLPAIALASFSRPLRRFVAVIRKAPRRNRCDRPGNTVSTGDDRASDLKTIAGESDTFKTPRGNAAADSGLEADQPSGPLAALPGPRQAGARATTSSHPGS